MAKEQFDSVTNDMFEDDGSLFAATCCQPSNDIALRLSKNDNLASRIELEVSKPLLDKLTLAAKNKNISRSELIEDLLQQHFIENNGSNAGNE